MELFIYIIIFLSIISFISILFNLIYLLSRKRLNSKRQNDILIQAKVLFEEWKDVAGRELRSKAIRYGQKFEQFIPFAIHFPFNRKDAHFQGMPIDLIVYDGLDDGDLKDIVFVEVKTGSSGLTKRERQVRNAIQEKRVRWIKLDDHDLK